jgi:membrane protein DedA with SNARE-associated domain
MSNTDDFTSLLVICTALVAAAIGMLIWYETRRGENETAEETLDRITW